MFVAHEDTEHSKSRTLERPGSDGAAMIITLVIDTFNVNNNGTTLSAMRFAATLISRGHTVRVVACGEPGDAAGQGAAERIARQHGVPAIAAFHIQAENVTYNIGLAEIRAYTVGP